MHAQRCSRDTARGIEYFARFRYAAPFLVAHTAPSLDTVLASVIHARGSASYPERRERHVRSFVDSGPSSATHAGAFAHEQWY